MTMLHSDSESQDSDDGRRFRFETTRKDSNFSKFNQRTSPSHTRQSRSHDRFKHNCKDERLNYQRRKEPRTARDDRWSPKDQRNRDESRRKDETRYREDLRHKNNYKDTWDSGRRDSKSRDSKEYKSKDDKRKRSRERSYEKNRTNENRKVRQSSRDREKSVKKTKIRDNNDHDDNKLNLDVDELDGNEKKCVDDDRLSIEAQDCKELNLSDFDIVSDIENSSNSSDDDMKESDSENNRRNVKTLEDKMKSPTTSTQTKISEEIDEDVEEIDEDDEEIKKKNLNTSRIDEKYDDKSVESDNTEDDCYGPMLPPSLKKNKMENSDDLEQPEKIKIIGPCLPGDFNKETEQKPDVAEDEDEAEDIIGPSLPVTIKNPTKATIGPSIPDDWRQNLAMQVDHDDDEKRSQIDDDKMVENDENDDDVLGPLPADHPGIESHRVQQQLEYRARLIKKELAEIEYQEEKRREEWMTELPSVHVANLGLGPRKFRTREGPDMSDRSGWTDTPADRAKKEKDILIGKRVTGDGDCNEEESSKKRKASKRDGDSLLEIHQKKIHKKKKKDEKKAKKDGATTAEVRRPFSRDIDLQANRFDEARKKTIIMKAQSLDDRFSRGKI